MGIGNPCLLEGLKSYTLCQADLQEHLVLSFHDIWATPLHKGIEELHTELGQGEGEGGEEDNEGGNDSEQSDNKFSDDDLDD